MKILSEASYEELYERDKERQLSLMKDYIKKGNNLKKYAAAKKSEADIKVNISKARSEMFLVQEVKTSISYLQEIFKVDISNINDDEIKSRKDDMSKNLQQLNILSKKMQNLLECANSVIEDQIEYIVGSYNHIKKLKDVYQQTIKDGVAKQEILKLKLFSESKLKINISKFSGYDSRLDVYTFQSEFIKIYKQTTPKRMMSDVLKNNQLEGAALSLAQSVDNYDEIWQRLKSAYGDPKLLLKKKLSKISQLSKLKDTERVVAALSQVINTIKDLQGLASEHHIES